MYGEPCLGACILFYRGIVMMSFHKTLRYTSGRSRVMMNFQNHIRQSRLQHPCCRDRGWTWGWAGALCLSWRGSDHDASRSSPQSYCHEDKHKAHSTTHPLPLPLQHVGPQAAFPLPALIVKVHHLAWGGAGLAPYMSLLHPNGSAQNAIRHMCQCESVRGM